MTPKLPQPRNASDVPLYVRWTPERCPFALEMRLDLISRLNANLAQAERIGIEIGGMLFGSLPTPQSPTLRVDEVYSIPRRLEDGPIYMLDEAQQQRFAELSASATGRDRAAVGFFRSHARSGEIKPALADKNLLEDQFPEGIYALLLVGAKEPRSGSFFVSSAGQLSDFPSTPSFNFDEDGFKNLPEVPVESTEDIRNFSFLRVGKDPFGWLSVIGAILLFILITIWAFGGPIMQLLRPSSNQVDLKAIPSGNALKISWDHASPLVRKARGALLVINDGSSHKEVRMDIDDLKIGQVEYERLTKKVFLILTLDAPELNVPPQTYDWVSD